VSFARKQPKIWYAIDVIVNGHAREAGEYGLMEAGALGTETKDADDNNQLVTGYFDAVPNRELVRTKLAEAMRVYNILSSSIRKMDLREVPDEDWLAEWKKSWSPIETGRFIIAPPWDDYSSTGDRVLITIEPGMAFGTGTHETTRLCLLAIENYYEGGSFLDVGTGTGILAIAAAKISNNARIQACDTDPEAIAIATENAQLNRVGDRINFHTGTIDDSTPSSDLVCANLTADVIAELMPALLGVTCRRLVLSGILESQVTSVMVRARECGGPAPIEITNDGEWSAIIL
jgi:ribosomal protein L11 methyltransferase